MRSRNLGVFYTDRGVLPRSTLQEVFPALSSFSVHTLSGSATFQAVLFVTTGVFAVFLTVGYRTKVATLGSVVLLWGVQSRNPLIVTGGDLILTTLLVFGFFLPLGARLSFDSVRSTTTTTAEEATNGIRAAAPLIFISVLLYFHNGIVRLGDELWLTGDAVYRMFGYDSFTVGLGNYVSELPMVLTAMNYAWFGVLVAAPLLILLTRWLRVGFVMAFIGACVGMFLTLRLGLFPLIMATGLVLFLPPVFWDAASRRFPSLGLSESLENRIRNRLYFDGMSILPEKLVKVARTAGSLFVGLLLITGVLWSASALGYVGTSGDGNLPDRYIFFFDPNEGIYSDGWYTAPAELASGDMVDAYKGGEVNTDRPPNLATEYPTDRWHMYLLLTEGGLHSAHPAVQEDFAEYLCQSSQRELQDVTVYFHRVPARSDISTRERIVHQDCAHPLTD
jgi:hypothetical protein